MKIQAGIIALGIGLLAIATSVVAQENNNFGKAFGGQWVTFSTVFSNGGNCILNLSSTKTDKFYPTSPSKCQGALANVAGWTINNGQLTLVTADQKTVATLGGNQFRLSGETQDSKIAFVIERKDRAQKIALARKSIKCTYVGYGQECAKPRQFAPPVINAGKTSPVKILVSLNARAEPRLQTKVIGVLKPNTCIQVKACTLASDGLWCQALFNNQTGWFKKQAVRQGKWPVMTFLSGC